MPLGQPLSAMHSTLPRRPNSAAPAQSINRRYRRGNLLQKLKNRETLGEFIRGVGLTREPAKQLFDKVPERLIFNLKDTIPNLGNHILMGATRCGQILLTYTYLTDSASDFYPNMSYRYRLHFWLFRPGRAAAKIGEVQLFDGNIITDMLSIGIVQWPNDNERLLVYGTCQGTSDCEMLDGWGIEYERRSSTYVTLTTVPCLTGCEKCRAVAASFDEEEMAAGWDCGVGLSCMRHGLTIHTHFNAPHAYPLDPTICLASGNRMVFNTGAFLHSFSVSVESGGQAQEKESTLVNRLSYSFLRDRGYSVFVSDDWACNVTQLLFKKLGEPRMLFQLEISQLPLCIQYALKRHIQKYNTLKCKSSKKGQTDKRCSDYLAALLSHEVKRPKQRWFSSNNRSLGFSNLLIDKSKSVERIRKAENVYDFMETDDLSCEPKFKLFRRRCLADKMYEFRSDEDMAMDNENIYPGETPPTIDEVENDKKGPDDVIKKDRIKKPVELSTMVKAIMADWEINARDESEAERKERVVGKFMAGIFSKASSLSLSDFPSKKVNHIWSPLRPLNKTGGGYPVTSPTKSTARNIRQRKPFEMSDEMREEMDKGFGHQPVHSCSVKFTRRYIEVDQEITSTITDVEDDDENGTGFHCVLPVSAHGSSYSQMEMIANAKAMKLGILNAAVRQSSLDIEQLCFKAANYICNLEGFRFWFCSDYDTEIVRVCYETGDVLGVLFVRLNAEDLNDAQVVVKNKSVATADLRNFYETQCLYMWSPSKCQVYLEGFQGLRKVPMVAARPWCPAGKEARLLRSEISMCEGPEPRLMFHHVPDGAPVMRSLELILDHDNLIGFRKKRSGSPAELDSPAELALN